MFIEKNIQVTLNNKKNTNNIYNVVENTRNSRLDYKSVCEEIDFRTFGCKFNGEKE